MNRFLPGIIAMALIVVGSNILVQYQLGSWLTWGALTYPFAFLVTDIVNRVYGPSAARRVVVIGFAAGVACSLIAAGLDKTTLRIALASAVAFLSAQLVDITIFDALRHSRLWWRAPLISSVVGSALDTGLFFFIAFSAQLAWAFPADDVGWANALLPILGVGPAAPLWVSLGVADWLTKLTLALLSLVPFHIAVHQMLGRNR